MLYFTDLVQYYYLSTVFKDMNIFKRLAARISSAWAFDGLIQAIKDHNEREISWYLPLCSASDKTEALNFCIQDFQVNMFEKLFSRVQSTQQTLNLAAHNAAMGHLGFFEQILPAIGEEDKVQALQSLIRWADDSFVQATNRWKPSFDLFMKHGIDQNCILEEAVKLNNGAVFEYLFDNTQPNNYENLTFHFDLYQDKRIVDALIPYASPTKIEHLLDQAAWIGHTQYIRQLASVCDDHSRALAKVIAGSAQTYSKDLHIFEQHAQLLYPKSDPVKTLEHLYTDHEDFMDSTQSFDNILLKELHENIEVSHQRAVLSNAVGESTVVAPRRKM